MVAETRCHYKRRVSFVVNVVDVGTSIEDEADRICGQVDRRVGQGSRHVFSAHDGDVDLGVKQSLEDGFFTLACRSDDRVRKFTSSEVGISPALEQDIDDVTLARFNRCL
ncbi:hypothetical protein HG530_014887 [Fusarium avenaceum]|nr:hypothetical protein HG530_014887 [Fusarium avenaceum]